MAAADTQKLLDDRGMTYVRAMVDDDRGFTDEVWSAMTELGWTGLLVPEAESCRQINIKYPVINNEELAKLREVDYPGFKAITLPTTYPVAEGGAGLTRAAEELRRRASLAIADGFIHLWVGGGIVWDSEPAAEIEESWVKARPLLAAV